jgi:hypothetical protein
MALRIQRKRGRRQHSCGSGFNDTYRKASIKGVQATGEAFSLKREHPALQKMKFINFFLCLLAIFALLDPDPDYESAFGYGSSPGTPLNQDPIQIRFHNSGRQNVYDVKVTGV